MKSDKKMSTFKKTLVGNLQLILAVAAVGGVVVGLLNFYLLTTISPIERRVAAIEVRNAKVDPLVTDYVQNQVVIDNVVGDIKTIKTDIGTINTTLTAIKVAIAKIDTQ